MIGILFNVAGERVREINKTSAAAKDDFKAVVKTLTDHFKPIISIISIIISNQ